MRKGSSGRIREKKKEKKREKREEEREVEGEQIYSLSFVFFSLTLTTESGVSKKTT